MTLEYDLTQHMWHINTPTAKYYRNSTMTAVACNLLIIRLLCISSLSSLLRSRQALHISSFSPSSMKGRGRSSNNGHLIEDRQLE